MDNLRTASAVFTPARPASDRVLSRRTVRRGRLNIGADHVAAGYLDADRVAARRRELVATGYPVHIATLAVRLEGRENTLLDLLDVARVPGLDVELKAIQDLLWSLHMEHRAGRALA